MTTEIEHYANLLEFGYKDLLEPQRMNLKKHIIIKKLREKYNSYEIAEVFGYRNNQSVYHAIREASNHIRNDKGAKKLWEKLENDLHLVDKSVY